MLASMTQCGARDRRQWRCASKRERGRYLYTIFLSLSLSLSLVSRLTLRSGVRRHLVPAIFSPTVLAALTTRTTCEDVLPDVKKLVHPPPPLRALRRALRRAPGHPIAGARCPVPHSPRALPARPASLQVDTYGVWHHVPAKIVGKARRESVVMEEVERKHLGGFDVHKLFAKIPCELMAKGFSDSSSTSTPPGPSFPTYLPLAHSEGVRLSLARIFSKLSPRQPVMLDLRPNAFTLLGEGVLDHTEAAGVALMYDLRARDRDVLLDDFCRSSPSLATKLVDFDPDTRPPFRTPVDGPERRGRHSSPRVSQTPAGTPCREVLGR
ncbi:uncharacterized protein BXZ73DRAFT_109118 [Epithele typhae]|uniref:uncharacterized protein n=1 Tax=Epithele typhae TaxID=378194 RepID=UPI00200836CF|nr:uncharacterized protein BXZ73DRAFT_109118 [Epithele typhae]KAH9910354.1 hypothetical protein BXZ73DRAFT_109118 [Epithele typhae]